MPKKAENEPKSDENDEKILDLVISTKIAKQLIGLTAQRLGQLVTEGWLVRFDAGQWRLFDLVQGYIKFLKNEGGKTTRSAAETRIRDARAAEIELRTATRAGSLIEITEAEAAMDAVVGAIRTELGGIPARVTRDLTLRRNIEQELNDSLARVAVRFRAEAATLRKGGAPSGTVAALNS